MDSKRNIKNLKPFGKNSVLTEEEQRIIQSNGGKASVEARRAKKTAREYMNIVLDQAVTGKKSKQLLENMGVEETDQNNKMLLMATLCAKGIATGDANTIAKILEIAGDLEAQQSEQQAPTININVAPATIYDIEEDEI